MDYKCYFILPRLLMNVNMHIRSEGTFGEDVVSVGQLHQNGIHQTPWNSYGSYLNRQSVSLIWAPTLNGQL